MGAMILSGLIRFQLACTSVEHHVFLSRHSVDLQMSLSIFSFNCQSQSPAVVSVPAMSDRHLVGANTPSAHNAGYEPYKIIVSTTYANVHAKTPWLRCDIHTSWWKTCPKSAHCMQYSAEAPEACGTCGTDRPRSVVNLTAGSSGVQSDWLTCQREFCGYHCQNSGSRARFTLALERKRLFSLTSAVFI